MYSECRHELPVLRSHHTTISKLKFWTLTLFSKHASSQRCRRWVHSCRSRCDQQNHFKCKSQNEYYMRAVHSVIIPLFVVHFSHIILILNLLLSHFMLANQVTMVQNVLGYWVTGYFSTYKHMMRRNRYNTKILLTSWNTVSPWEGSFLNYRFFHFGSLNHILLIILNAGILLVIEHFFYICVFLIK